MTLAVFLITIMLFIFLIGLCIGSFLNVVVLRAFSNESICFPGSKCPSCNIPLKWYHNIPILSYLILKGKCAFCKDTISMQYPIVELITGFLFVAIFIKFGLGIQALFTAIFTSLFIVMAATDIKERVVFDIHTYILVVTGLIYNFFSVGSLYNGDKVILLERLGFGIAINNSFIASIIGIIVGIVVMELFARFGYLVAGQRAFGEGDTYIAAGLGAIFGWKYLITVLAYAFIIQIILTLPVYIKKLYSNNDYKTLVSFFVFFSLAILLKWADYTDLFNSALILLIISIMLAIVGIYLCVRIIKGLKDKASMIYLPFGPALVLAALLEIFLS